MSTQVSRRRRDQALARRVFLPTDAPEVACKVRCNGAMHRVVFSGGRLRFPDHPGLNREAILFEFGSRCRCLEVKKAWDSREGSENVERRGDLLPSRFRPLIPRDLLRAFDEWRFARAESRDRQRVSAGRSTRELTLEAMKSRLIKAATGAIEGCGYAPLVEVQVGRPYVWTWPSEARLWRFTLKVWVGLHWSSKVYQRGLAVIDGRFVLAALTAEDLWHWESLTVEDPRPPWWLDWFGRHPELGRGQHVLALWKGRHKEFRVRPALVSQSAGPDGLPRKTLQFLRRRCR